jgi:hypothetical protein
MVIFNITSGSLYLGKAIATASKLAQSPEHQLQQAWQYQKSITTA